MTCERCGEDFECWPSQEEETRQCSECFQEYGHLPVTREKIRQEMLGREIEWADKISDTVSEEGNWMQGRTGEDCPNYGRELTEEHKRKIGKAHEGHDPYYIPNPSPVEALDGSLIVRSRWEKEIAEILDEENIEFEYEAGWYDIGESQYQPDFLCGDVVIEVKGRVYDTCEERAEMFMEYHSELQYIVVGSELPSDIHIPWNEREKLVSVVE